MSAYRRSSTSTHRVSPASANRSVHHSKLAIQVPLHQPAVGVDGQVGLGHRAPVVGAEPVVVVHPPGADLALEVAVGPGPVGPERRDRGVEVAAADPGQLGQGVRHPVRRQVLEDLEGGDELEGAVRPRESGEQVGHPDVAHRSGAGVVDGELAQVAPLGVDPPFAGAPPPGSRWRSPRRGRWPP